MTRLAFAIVVATAVSGCQHSGQQAIDPFWGQTTVPSPATGSIGVSPGYSQPLQQPIITPGTPLPSGCEPQSATPPNLLPAQATPTPSPAGTLTPMPATTGTGGNGVPYGYGAPAAAAPPSGYGTPPVAPPSGYSNPGLPPSSSPGPLPAGGGPGYSPSGGYNFDNRNGSTRPSSGGNWVTPAFG